MNTSVTIANWLERLHCFMSCSLEKGSHASSGEDEFNQLALELHDWQASRNPILERSVRRIGKARPVHWTEIPALPVVAFKEFEVTCLTPAERCTVFYSSGTTGASVSRHFHHAASLSLYERSLLAWFQKHVRVAPEGPRPLFLTPSPRQAPHSSLVHMFDTVRRHLAGDHAWFAGHASAPDGAWNLRLDRIESALRLAEHTEQSVALFGTAFSFVQLLDDMESRNLQYALPPGSCAMETGGYKGRTRALEKSELHQWMRDRLGLGPSSIISEYGMSELGSQAYDGRVPDGEDSSSPSADLAPPPTASRVFQFPPWARARVVSPENGQEVAVGETGLIQVYDLANAWSAMAIQTEDLAIRHARGMTLLGRSPQAAPKGCSLHAARLS